MEKFLTCEQIAERYCVTVCAVREWIKSGKLPALKIAGRAGYRIRPSDLAAFEKQYRTAVKKEA